MKEADYRRRDFLALMGVGGVTFASALYGCGGGAAATGGAATSTGSAAGQTGASSGTANGATAAMREDFFFLQLSDTHWGFKGPANPDADTTLAKTVARIRSVATRPDFIVFTGDLTHMTPKVAERKERMKQFKDLIAPVESKVLFLPGEHDASLDRGDVYKEAFGEIPYSFDHKGLHFVALDNASAPDGNLGDAQLAWLEKDLAAVPPKTPVVVFAHRPLFDLYPEWEWATGDGARAIEILSRRETVTVFYGHIHQEHRKATGNIIHYAARSLVFPLPAPGSVPQRAALPWDGAARDHGIGYRRIKSTASQLELSEEHEPTA